MLLALQERKIQKKIHVSRRVRGSHLAAADDVGVGGEQIDQLALALVAPLGSQDDGGLRHRVVVVLVVVVVAVHLGTWVKVGSNRIITIFCTWCCSSRDTRTWKDKREE
jgi:hypothetical protein